MNVAHMQSRHPAAVAAASIAASAVAFALTVIAGIADRVRRGVR